MIFWYRIQVSNKERNASAVRVRVMKANDFMKNNYNELSKRAKRIIETSDQSFNEWVGEFESVEDFNNFVTNEFND